jgi:hypothetical protein
MAGKVCLRTDIDRQHLLPHGTPEEIAATVRGLVDRWRRYEGGLIGSGQVGPDVPLANAEAMLAAFWEATG